jgi:hypothetical protein
MASPQFYLLRLRNASIPELVWRLQQRLTRVYSNCLNRLGRKLPEVPQIEAAALTDLIMPNLFPVENAVPSQGIDISNGSASGAIEQNWLDTGKLAAAYTNSGPKDIRLVWEPARLQHTVARLVYADHHPELPGLKNAGQTEGNMILDWLNAHPFLKGVHYKSAMECALRIPVFFTALKRIDDLKPNERDRITQALYRHAWLIAKELSLYSSLGNHTVTEAVGLVFAGAVYRSTLRGKAWLKTGIRLLNDELSHQILDDGGPAEQSLGYHRFVLDIYWLAMEFIRENNLGKVDHWLPRLKAGEFFLSAFQDRDGQVPAIGDCDDGFAVAPGVMPSRAAGAACNDRRITFEDSGYSIIRSDSLVFTLDHGPLGMAPLYNHGHADALSITLCKNGRPLLVDPGTYRYNGVPQWRWYFKSTRAHNTVTIDDQDQAVQATGFIWSQPFHAQLTAFESEHGDLFYKAVHDGYMRLSAPVRHQRCVFFFDQENFLIQDRFIGTSLHCFQINFHLHPQALVTVDGRWCVVDNGGEQIFLSLLEGDFQLVRGRNNPLMGWYSSRYGHKEPTSTLTFTRTGEADSVVFTTAICTQSALGHERLDIKAGEFEAKIENS